jgi:hypothetical protein
MHIATLGNWGLTGRFDDWYFWGLQQTLADCNPTMPPGSGRLHITVVNRHYLNCSFRGDGSAAIAARERRVSLSRAGTR